MCTGTQYIEADACKDCANAAKGRISKDAKKTGCKCTAADAEVVVTDGSEDCSCKTDKKIGLETVAYK